MDLLRFPLQSALLHREAAFKASRLPFSEQEANTPERSMFPRELVVSALIRHAILLKESYASMKPVETGKQDTIKPCAKVNGGALIMSNVLAIYFFDIFSS
ncbi:hypothetical protein DM860_003592 [Cuscuta australis]|uniref:Uncharacterized protein n=1 Tax=Cuscuta australis TaxID=267555 RepID=A0A328DLE3_9ASTE|nr:hypothetical protein DM860_003592 [Cuscuta australis]